MTQKNILRSVVQNYPKNIMEAGEFFISWNGVLTLAYRGFNPVLLKMKREIEDKTSGLQAENPGSKWPKITIGALRDDRTLSWSDALTLRQICDTFKDSLQKVQINIDALSIVIFHCRSLERRLSTEIISLNDPRNFEVSSVDHADEDVVSHAKYIAKTMDQFSSAKLAEYWPNLQKQGNREGHYRASFMQATLVHDLKVVPDVIENFRRAVDRQLPGLYCWFKDESLHMTVRALA